jgi:hypothetical protein
MFMESKSDVSLLVSGTETSEKAEVAQQRTLCSLVSAW